VQARLEDIAQCLLIIIRATPEGKKELVGLTDVVRDSVQSWRELLLDLKRRGLSIGPSSRSTRRQSAAGALPIRGPVMTIASLKSSRLLARARHRRTPVENHESVVLTSQRAPNADRPS
jgi:hypothetical protein